MSNQKKDRLEQFIADHRLQFETTLEDRDLLWREIQVKLTEDEPVQKPPARIIKISKTLISIAACSALLVFAILGIKSTLSTPLKQNETYAEMEKMSKFYATFIDQQMESISPNSFSDELKRDLKELQLLEHKILLQVKSLPEYAQPQLLQALKINYENQLNILENQRRINTILEKTKSTDHENHLL